MGLRIATAALAAMVLALPARAELVGHGGLVKGVAAGEGGRLISGGFDNSVILWDVGAGKPQAILHGHDAAVNAVAFLPGDRALSAGDDGKLILWDLRAAKPARETAAHQGRIAGLAVSPDGARAATAGWDQKLRLWDLASGQGRDLDGMVGNANAVAFSPDGGHLAAGGQDGTVRVWRLADGTLERTLGGGGLAVNGVAFAADGSALLAATAEGALRQWRLPDGDLVREVALSPVPLLSLAAKGGLAAAGGVDGTATVLSVASGDRVERISAHRGGTWGLAFSPNGERLHTAGTDGAVRIWDPETGRQIGPPAQPGAPVVAMTPALDGPARDPGEVAFRRCVACHTVTPDGGNRAGPTLHGIFGRRAGGLDGYPYSPALKDIGIVWTPETVADLFTRGPHVVTPGSKMPTQVIGDPEELRDLVRWLEEKTQVR